jgi:hypothetical protein
MTAPFSLKEHVVLEGHSAYAAENRRLHEVMRIRPETLTQLATRHPKSMGVTYIDDVVIVPDIYHRDLGVGHPE